MNDRVYMSHCTLNALCCLNTLNENFQNIYMSVSHMVKMVIKINTQSVNIHNMWFIVLHPVNMSRTGSILFIFHRAGSGCTLTPRIDSASAVQFIAINQGAEGVLVFFFNKDFWNGLKMLTSMINTAKWGKCTYTHNTYQGNSRLVGYLSSGYHIIRL